MKILATLILLGGAAIAFMGFSTQQTAMGLFGVLASLVSLGLFLNVRWCGYLLAALFGWNILVMAAALFMGKEFNAAVLARMAIWTGLGWWCFVWAWNLGLAQAAAKPKPKPATIQSPPIASESQSQLKEKPPEVLKPDDMPDPPVAKFAWVWLVALGSFVPFGVGVWYFVGRDSKQATNSAIASPKPAPAPNRTPTVKPAAIPPQALTPTVVTNKETPLQNAKAPSIPVSKAATNLPAPPVPATPVRLPPWKIAGAKPAGVEVKKMKLVPLVVSTNALGWEDVPPVFRERSAQIMALTVPAGVETGVAEYTVRSSGYALIACNFGYQGNNSGDWQSSRWQPSDFAANGWTSIPQTELGGFLTSVDVHRVQVIFWKNLAAGETGRIRCNKYYPPYFIVLGEP